MEKIIRIFEKHPIKCIFGLFITLSTIPPLIVHCIYKIPAVYPFFEAVIPAGDMISYMGTVLTFCATFLLSVLVFVQNKKNELESKLATNKIYISEANNKNIVVAISKVGKKDNFVRLNFAIKFNVLSETLISDMYLESYSLADESASWASIACGWEFRRQARLIDFQYKDKGKIEVVFMIAELEKEKIDFFLKKRNITMYLRVGFVCENIVTYIQTKLVLVKDSGYISEDKYLYEIVDSYIRHEDIKFINR